MSEISGRGLRGASLAGLLAVLCACEAEQSALHPASENAREIARLFWVMTLGGALIWAVVMGIAVYAVLGRSKPTSERFADRFILAGGVVFPTVVLAALLLYGLRLLPDWRAEDAPDLRVAVTGEQFWWRIAYELPDGSRIETANELHLPKGRVVEFELTAHDVIHSFWIPPLGGKLDLLPGRRNVMRMTPAGTGRFRGVCAEFCGPSHALMAFPVIVHEPEAFDAWLAAEAAPADPATDAGAFRAAGCGACHRVRGLVAEGAVGPDLTHLARRETLAAGTLPMSEAALTAWLADPRAIKPDARMPAFSHLTEGERRAILSFLTGLR